jgi:hypothetical protein
VDSLGIDWSYRRAAWCSLNQAGVIVGEGAVRKRSGVRKSWEFQSRFTSKRALRRLVSREIQRRARDRRDAARQRERNARERARVNEERGESMLSRLHRETAERQSAAAASAEGLRQLDVAAEGDKLDDSPAGERS